MSQGQGDSTNTNTGANQGGSSPNPNRNNSHRRRPASASPVRGRGSPRGSPARTPPRPIMGVPGVSAFRPYRSQHPQTPPSGGATGGSHAGQGFPAVVAAPMPVGGGGGGLAIVAAPGGFRLGGSPLGKRLAPGGEDLVPSGGEHLCTVCGRAFVSSKALFGHMRSHPDRGWKGAHPPPTFKPEEEFADIQGLNQPEGEVVPAAADGAGDQAVQAGGEAEEAAVEAPPEEKEAAAEGTGGNYRVPDLNDSPPVSNSPPEEDAK